MRLPRPPLLALTLTLGLAACASPAPIPPPPQGPPLTPDEIAARYVAGPSALPLESAAPLGVAGTVEGRVPRWGGTADTTLHTANGRVPTPAEPGPNLGTIFVGGRFVLTLPEAAFGGATAGDVALANFDRTNERCFVDTLAADPPGVRATSLQVQTRNTFPFGPGPAPTSVQDFMTVLPYSPDSAAPATVQLVFVERDVVLRGERRCLPREVPFRNIPTPQTSLAVNLRLARGWNVVKTSWSAATVGMTELRTVRVEGPPNEVAAAPR